MGHTQNIRKSLFYIMQTYLFHNTAGVVVQILTELLSVLITVH